MNDFGQLGIGTADPAGRFRPTRVTSQLRFHTIDAGAWHTCAIALDGRTYCWGHNGDGRSGTPLDSACVRYGHRVPCNLVPTPVSTDLRFTAISAGAFTTCGVSDTAGYCWGTRTVVGTDAALDDLCREHYPCISRPVPVAGGIAFRSIAIGDVTACGVSTAGRVYCWGHNQFSTLGLGINNDSTYRVPQPIVGGLVLDTVAVGPWFACGLTSRGLMYCWGSGVRGVMGAAEGIHNNSPTRPFRRPRFASIAAGWSHACGISLNGKAYCWGENTFGQLGSGRIGPDSVAVPTTVVRPQGVSRR